MASGDTLCVFFPEDNQPPTTNYATFDTRNAIPVLDFDDTTDEEAQFTGVMPAHYAGTTGVTVTILWMATDTTVGPDNVVWQAAFLSISDDADDLDSKSFAAFNGSGAVAEPSASGEVGYDDITFTDGADMDSVAAGEAFRLTIRRDADDTSATDSLSGDAELLAVLLTET